MSKKAKWFLLILAGLIVFAAFIGFQFYRLWQQDQVLNAELAAQNKTLDAINGEIAAKQQELEDSKSNDWVERMARELFGWVKPGEIKIVDKDN